MHVLGKSPVALSAARSALQQHSSSHTDSYRQGPRTHGSVSHLRATCSTRSPVLSHRVRVAKGEAWTGPLSVDKSSMETIPSSALSVAIIGNGIMGLTTALQLRQKFPDVQITLISDREIKHTTSFGAAGLWEPYQIEGTSDELINRWGKATFDHLLSVMHSPACASAGVQQCGVYSLFTSEVLKPERPAWHTIAIGFRDLTIEQIHSMGMKNFVAGWAFDTLVTDQTYYLQWLHSQLVSQPGVTFKTHRLSSIQDLAGRGFSVVFNCAGPGSEELVKDETCFPIRGQVARLKAPWIKHVYFFDNKCYVIPNLDTLVIGGTAQRGNYSEVVDPQDSVDIKAAVSKHLISLKDAPVAYEWAGLRPGRSGVRLEREDVFLDDEAVAVVHNYGHGGSGITLHWGCTEDAIDLVAGCFVTRAGDPPGVTSKL